MKRDKEAALCYKSYFKGSTPLWLKPLPTTLMLCSFVFDKVLTLMSWITMVGVLYIVRRSLAVCRQF